MCRQTAPPRAREDAYARRVNRLWLLSPFVAVTVWIAALGPAAHASSDPLGCDALVFDPEGLLATSTVESARAQTAKRLGADARVRVEGTLDGGLEARWGQLLRQCDGWEVDGDVAPDLVVMMFSISEREASVYYGADQGPALESRWSDAVDAMTAQFADEDYTQGVRAGLSALRGDRTIDFAPVSPSSDDGGGGSGRTILVVILIALAYVAFVSAKQKMGWSSSSDDSSNWSSRPRSSSWFSGGGSSRRSRSSSRSRRSSGGGSRRSGGGTKKW
ncbi:hypothetical protein BH24ACT5_BH24ACT5_18760 [soil metagenome]